VKEDPVSRALSRRTLLKKVIFGGTLALGHVIPRVQAEERDVSKSETDRLVVHVVRPLDAETPVQEFTAYLTANSRFFVRSHFGPPPVELLSAQNWRLSVDGMVDRSLIVTLTELKQFEEVSVTAVVQCSGNGRAFHRPKAPGVQWERGAVGNAQWAGVRLRDVLAKAGIQAGAHHVQFQGADRPVVASVPLFTRSIPLEKALHPDTILAYEMNGRPLPLLHGAPLRVITPGWMADSCTKWLTEITVQAAEAKGYYMQTAYRVPMTPVEQGRRASGQSTPVEAMVVKSLVAAPKEGETVKSGPVSIQGVAWGGEVKVAMVEVSLDEGKTWETARLVGEDHSYAWRQWQLVWKAKTAGTFTILCRATDDHGQTQPKTSPWNPSGFLWNGWDRVTITVAA
jgi:sulfite oxidase